MFKNKFLSKKFFILILRLGWFPRDFVFAVSALSILVSKFANFGILATKLEVKRFGISSGASFSRLRSPNSKYNNNNNNAS